VINALLTEIEDKPEDVFLLCSTNRPWAIDSAFRRRFNKMIYVPLPGMRDRGRVFRYHLEQVENLLTANDYHFLAEVTRHYSPCDIQNIVTLAKNERMSRIKRAKYFIKCPKINSNPQAENQFIPCKKGDGGKTNSAFGIPNHIFHPPITMKDIERATWIAKATGEVKDLAKLKEFAKSLGQTIDTDDERDDSVELDDSDSDKDDYDPDEDDSDSDSESDTD